MPTDQIVGPLTRQFGSLIGGIISAVLLLILAWIVAAILRWLVTRLLTAMNADQRLRAPGLTKTLGTAVFWLTWLVFLPAILAALGVSAILEPLTAMVNTFLAYVPLAIGAIIILVIGVFIARILRQIVTGLLEALGANRIGGRFGFTRLAELVGTIVYILVLIPTIIAALQALKLNSITDPLTAMLTTFLSAVPGIIGAVVLLVVAYYIGRVVAEVLTDLLSGLGFDNLFVWLGLSRSPAQGGARPSSIVGNLALIFIIYTAALQAAYLMNWTALGELLSRFLGLAVQVIMGLIVIGFGLWLGNLLAGVVRSTNLAQRNFLALLTQAAVFILFGAMGLTQMGLGDQIVVLAFSLTLGAVAVAAALAFGLGGRGWAARVLDDVRSSVERQSSPSVELPPGTEPPSIPPATGPAAPPPIVPRPPTTGD